MQDEKHNNALQLYNYNLYNPLKTWLKRAKWTLKSGILAAKSM